MAKAQVSSAGDVAELVISAPPLNLFDGQLITDLEAALDDLDALIRARTARAVLLRAEGKVFCAGVDVHEFQGWSPGPGWPGRPSW
jgi:enoyl-CoA hydratase/carnithine racemase